MENASKALIIAGAILLAIVIISLGLIVVNNVRNTADNTDLSEQEIQSFNAKFVGYEGSGISGSRINTLIQQVIATNQSSSEAGKSTFITIAFPSVSLTSEVSYYVGVSLKNGSLWAHKFKPAANTASDVSDRITSNAFNNAAGDTGISYTVNTGKNYTVTLKYENGLVKYIIVN